MGTGPSATSEDVTAALLGRQLRGIDAWTGARRARRYASSPTTSSREARMDAARRREALDRAHDALVARLDTVLAAEAGPMLGGVEYRAIVAHRQESFVQRTTDALAELGVSVVAALDNGADAVGVLVAEQPDLLLVEETLPMLTGRQVVAQAVRFAPDTMLVAQIVHPDLAAAWLDAGVRTAVARRVPPAVVAEQMRALLDHRLSAACGTPRRLPGSTRP